MSNIFALGYLHIFANKQMINYIRIWSQTRPVWRPHHGLSQKHLTRQFCPCKQSIVAEIQRRFGFCSLTPNSSIPALETVWYIYLVLVWSLTTPPYFLYSCLTLLFKLCRYWSLLVSFGSDIPALMWRIQTCVVISTCYSNLVWSFTAPPYSLCSSYSCLKLRCSWLSCGLS